MSYGHTQSLILNFRLLPVVLGCKRTQRTARRSPSKTSNKHRQRVRFEANAVKISTVSRRDSATAAIVALRSNPFRDCVKFPSLTSGQRGVFGV